MTREIKFRAWCEGKHKSLEFSSPFMDYDVAIMNGKYADVESNWDIQGVYETIPIMQFTGLHDKNGKEIYEGDIVRINEAQRNYVVKFNSGCFKLFHADPQLNDMLWGTIERVSELLWTVEIIGNIYENSELIQP